MEPSADTSRPRALPHVRERGAIARGGLLVLGSIAFALGVVGLFLPLVPSVPFFIGAAACFARAHRPFHDWMLRHRWIGPPLREWHRHRAMPYWSKVALIVTTLVSFGISIAVFVHPVWLKIALSLVALALAVWLYRIPSRDGAAITARRRPRSDDADNPSHDQVG
jgi:uncharacterized membrane protein YbaN (DUF454 family)